MIWRSVSSDQRSLGSKSLLVLSILGALMFSFESWALGPYSWMYGYGAGLETLPAHLALSFDDRQFSLWAPFVAGGVDRLSFWGNADLLSIEALLVHALPPWLANGVHRGLQYFVAIYFTSRVCAEQFSLEPRWSYLAGLLHACFAYFTFGDMLAFPGVALLVWLLDQLRKPNRPLVWAPVAGAAFSAGTSFTHSDPYLLAFAFAWAIFVWRDLSAQTLLRLTAFFLGLIALDGPQLVAALANAPFSQRASLPQEELSLTLDGLFYRQLHFDFFNQDPLTKSITMILPGIALLGLLPLAIISLRDSARKDLAARFLVVAALYVLLSQRWLFVGLQALAGNVLPWISGVYMGRFYTLPAAFLIACFLALGLRLAWTCVGQRRVARACAAGVLVGFVSFMAIWPKIALSTVLGIDDMGQANFRVEALENLRSSDRDLYRVASVLPLQPSYAYAQGFETADGWVNLYPARYRELWLRILHPLFSEVPKARTSSIPTRESLRTITFFSAQT
jgi:hypothetical protein